MRTLNLILLILSSFVSAARADLTCQTAGGSGCTCPSGYAPYTLPDSTQGCRPLLSAVAIPSGGVQEFFLDDEGYPVCGQNRIPVYDDGYGYMLKSLNVATSGRPNSSSVTTVTGGPTTTTFPYSTPNPSGQPQYLYNVSVSGSYSMNRCTCTGPGRNITSSSYPQQSGPPVSLFYVNSGARFPSDSLNTLNNSMGAGDHAPVAIALSPGVDGRKGDIFRTNQSVCGCPNFNEKVVPVEAGDGLPTGSKCVPVIPANQRESLPVTFSPSMENTMVVNLSSEPRDANNALITRITHGSTVYDRKIWICHPPLVLNTGTGACEESHAYHKAGPSDTSTTPPSPPSKVSNRIGGATPDLQWANTVNKKLAACLNGFASDGTAASNFGGNTGEKFDCLANNINSFRDFNDLWSATDMPDDGGQMYALSLSNAQGKPISGFYRLDGSRCNNYSEFAAQVQPGRVNPANNLGGIIPGVGSGGPNEFLAQGTPIPMPGQGSGGGTAALTDVQSKLPSAVNRIPTTAAEKRECPILVRAAMVSKCPENPTCPPTVTVCPKPTYEVKDPGTNRVIRSQCTAAAEIKIHMRIEQVWEISGQPKMPVFDTIAQSSQASSISINRIIGEKYGVACINGMHRSPVTNTCTW